MLDFDRRYVLLPVLIGIAFVIAAYFVSESGRDVQVRHAHAFQRSAERNRLLTELQLVATDAESAQRGFMLTGNDAYLDPYRQSKEQMSILLGELSAAYDSSELGMAGKAAELRSLISTKFAEMDATLALYAQGRAQAMALVRTDFGQRAMVGVRDGVREMRDQERELVDAQTDSWLHAVKVNRILAAAGAVFSCALILLAGALVTRDLRRRVAAAADLESQVAKSTLELSELSTYLQRVSERERSMLARELHDELGGLLIAIKMDLSQLKSQLDLSEESIKTRWDRIQSTLSAGIDLKRRVIEQLRPSLLDNMGLVAALKWQVGEICAGANLKAVEHYPESEPEIVPDAAIAFFRVAQEALTNIVKHACATTVELALQVQDHRITLIVEDDGVGISQTNMQRMGSHGIAGMRHRLRSYDGDFVLERKEPQGTRVTVSVALGRVLKSGANAH
jgi:signal transduction histidine kinase